MYPLLSSGKVRIVFLAFIGLCAAGQATNAAPQARRQASAQKAAPAPAFSAVARPLHLEVILNDRQTGLIAAFEIGADGRMRAQRSELLEIGVNPPGDSADGELVVLDAVNGLTFVYDEPTQSIRMSVDNQLRAIKDYNVEEKGEDLKIMRSTGASLNYNIFTSGIRPLDQSHFSYQGASASLDGRLFSEWGVLSQSGIVGSNIASSRNVLRLDTTWSYSDPRSLMTYRAGDTISSGLAWTRPIRMGGAQVLHNFAVRPDLVTSPLPVVSGTAAVPSTLDVYINNVKSYTQQVNEGPYRVASLPIVGNGVARVVLYDSAGHQIEEEMPFFTTPLLLRPGFTDYSVEIGVPRNYYGSDSNGYARTLIGSASFRHGMNDWFTAEGHAEGSSHLANVGVGGVVRIMDRAVVNVAVTGSRSQYGQGALVYGALETRVGPITFSLSTQRAFSRYDDLASSTASTSSRWIGANIGVYNTSFDPLAFLTSSRPPRVLDRVSISAPVPFDSSNIGVAFTRMVNRDYTRSTIASVNWSRLAPFGSSVFVSAFTNVSGRRQAGVYAGLSIPLSRDITASAGVVLNNGKLSASTDISKPLGTEIGSYGWRVRDTEGRGVGKLRSVAGAYRTPWARIEATGAQEGRNGRGSLEVDGSIATLGGGMFLGNRIHDSFAVVDARAPGVEVSQDNQVIGVTDSGGKFLVPNLRSYQRNTIAINANNLPIDANAATTQEIVAPAARTGVLVSFGVKTDQRAAIITLVDGAGKPLAVGLHGKVDGVQEGFTIGYDGQAYMTQLGPENTVHVSTGLGSCTASFPYEPASAQAITGPYVCK